MTSPQDDAPANRSAEANPLPGGGAPGAVRPVSEKQRQILAGAREVFLSRGFDGASMGEIARVAGVSKGTLYVYFLSKEDLFAAVVSEVCEETAEQSFALDPDADVRAALTETGHLYLRAMIRAEHIATVRMVIGIAEKLPLIGRTFLAAGPNAGVARLSGWLAGKCERGDLVITDLELAAWQFLVGCHSLIVMPMLFGGLPPPDEATVSRVVQHGVDTFVRAYGTPAAAPRPPST